MNMLDIPRAEEVGDLGCSRAQIEAANEYRAACLLNFVFVDPVLLCVRCCNSLGRIVDVGNIGADSAFLLIKEVGHALIHFPEHCSVHDVAAAGEREQYDRELCLDG